MSSSRESGLERVRFQAGDATAFAVATKQAAELVIVNPPRRGIGSELCNWLEESTVKHCDLFELQCRSLARDLAAMPSFTARRVRLLDMFPQTSHYEVMVLLERS